jgi:hypothetical protein
MIGRSDIGQRRNSKHCNPLSASYTAENGVTHNRSRSITSPTSNSYTAKCAHSSDCIYWLNQIALINSHHLVSTRVRWNRSKLPLARISLESSWARENSLAVHKLFKWIIDLKRKILPLATPHSKSKHRAQLPLSPYPAAGHCETVPVYCVPSFFACSAGSLLN